MFQTSRHLLAVLVPSGAARAGAGAPIPADGTWPLVRR